MDTPILLWPDCPFRYLVFPLNQFHAEGRCSEKKQLREIFTYDCISSNFIR